MFFVLSKTLGIMLLPTNFLIGLGLLGMCILTTRFAPVGRRLLIISIVLLAVCGFSPLGSWVLYPLEQRFPAWNASHGTPDGIVVLGGAIDPDVSAAHGVAVLGASADRVTSAAVLAHQYPKARIIYSGGSGNLIADGAKEADYAADLFEKLGVPRARLEIERLSRNTQENAEFSKAIAAPKNGERWLLVTSAFHMPRSVGLFRKAGFAVEPYPVGWMTSGSTDLWKFRVFSLGGLQAFETGMREWIGLVAYWIAGKSSELFPGPEKP